MIKESLENIQKQIAQSKYEFSQVLHDLKENGIIDIFDTQFEVIVSKLRRLTLQQRVEIYDIIRPIINRKMILKGYEREPVKKITHIALIKLEYIVTNDINIPFSRMIAYAELEYEKKLQQSSIAIKNAKENYSNASTEIISLFEAFVSGGFVISDFLVVANTSLINDLSLKVSLLNTIFCGIIGLLDSVKGLR